MKTPVLITLTLMAPAIACCTPSASAADNAIVTSPTQQITQIAITDEAVFHEPWAMTFLPGSSYALITEKSGKLKLWRHGIKIRDVTGVPAVAYGGQGGLGDVVPAPDYRISKMIYLSWIRKGAGATNFAVVGRAKLDLSAPANPRLVGLAVIWQQSPRVTGQGHFSHRIAFSPDGQYLFISSGDRQKFTPAQDLKANLGKIVRLLPDGTPAPGNPFADKTRAGPQIWSYGHRNLLGLQFDAKGRLWDLEHGPMGGDELNLIQPGNNYGWPLVSNGDNYDGTPIPRHATRPDLTPPKISWNPVIAPGDFIFYSGAMFPAWKGQAICTGLKSHGLVRVSVDGESAAEIERIALRARIREVEQGPDGAIYILEDGATGRLRKITPAVPGA